MLYAFEHGLLRRRKQVAYGGCLEVCAYRRGWRALWGVWAMLW